MRTFWLTIGLISALAACGDSTTDGGGGSVATGGGGSGATGGGGSGATGGAATGGGGGAAAWEDCFGADGQNIEPALNLCTAETCLLEEHQIDCCGTVMLVGVEADSLAQFQACEAAWEASLPPCGCAPGPMQIQQPSGGTVSGADQATVGCINWTQTGGVCMTTPA